MFSTLALWMIFLSCQQHASAGTVLPIAFHFPMSLRSTQVHVKLFLIFQFGQFIPSGSLATVSHIKRYVNYKKTNKGAYTVEFLIVLNCVQTKPIKKLL